MASSASNSVLIGNPGAFDSIQTATVSNTTTTSITFSSIPSTYKHLRVISYWSDSNTANNTWLYTTFNGDTGSNYDWHRMYGNGDNIPPQASAGANAVYAVTGSDNQGNADYWAGADMIIPNYTGDGNKSIQGYSFQNRGSSSLGIVLNWTSEWRNTSAITSMTITADATQPYFRQGSKFGLYGIKG